MITVNGAQRPVPTPPTVEALLDALAVDPQRRGIAVAVGADVVPRAYWDTHVLRCGDHVEVLTAIQGG